MKPHRSPSPGPLRAASAVVLALVVALAPGCGDDDAAAPSDAASGLDSGFGQRDGGTTPRGDAGVRECIGVATECGTLDVETCGTVMGCAPSSCGGIPVACSERSMTQCMATGSCRWTAGACEGTAPAACSDVSDEGRCRMEAGCSWGTRSACRGAPVPCTMLARDVCETQPGCRIHVTPHDAGEPLPDAGCGSFDAGTLTADVDLHVVLGPTPLSDGAAVPVRIESPCGGSMENATDATGRVHFSVDRAMGPWSVTVAKAGYAAVSIVDVASAPVTGYVRLDPLVLPEELAYGVNGTLTGSVGAGHTVQIDAFNFTTIRSAGPTWMSSFTAGAQSLLQPLRFTAIELDSMGHAVSFATTEVPRTEMAITGVVLDLPTPALAPAVATFGVRFPTSGMITAADATVVGTFAEHLSTLDDAQWVYSGTAQATLGAPGATVTVQHFPGEVETNFVGASFDGPSARLNIFRNDLSLTGDVVIGPGSVTSSGGTLASLEVRATGLAGHDAIAIHLGQAMRTPPRWRVFAPTLPTLMRVPHLPTAVSLADIGITPGASLSYLVLLIGMESGDVWSTRAARAGVAGYRYTIAGAYQTVIAGP